MSLVEELEKPYGLWPEILTSLRANPIALGELETAWKRCDEHLRGKIIRYYQSEPIGNALFNKVRVFLAATGVRLSAPGDEEQCISMVRLLEALDCTSPLGPVWKRGLEMLDEPTALDDEIGAKARLHTRLAILLPELGDHMTIPLIGHQHGKEVRPKLLLWRIPLERGEKPCCFPHPRFALVPSAADFEAGIVEDAWQTASPTCHVLWGLTAVLGQHPLFGRSHTLAAAAGLRLLSQNRRWDAHRLISAVIDSHGQIQAATGIESKLQGIGSLEELLVCSDSYDITDRRVARLPKGKGLDWATEWASGITRELEHLLRPPDEDMGFLGNSIAGEFVHEPRHVEPDSGGRRVEWEVAFNEWQTTSIQRHLLLAAPHGWGKSQTMRMQAREMTLQVLDRGAAVAAPVFVDLEVVGEQGLQDAVAKSGEGHRPVVLFLDGVDVMGWADGQPLRTLLTIYPGIRLVMAGLEETLLRIRRTLGDDGLLYRLCPLETEQAKAFLNRLRAERTEAITAPISTGSLLCVPLYLRLYAAGKGTTTDVPDNIVLSEAILQVLTPDPQQLLLRVARKVEPLHRRVRMAGYLRWVSETMLRQAVPIYAPEPIKDRPFQKLHQRVRLIQDRRLYEEYIEYQREMDKSGLAGQEAEPRVSLPETLDWDRAGRRIRRAVLLGEAGAGKSWLLRTEAYRISRRALWRLRRNLALDSEVPIYCWAPAMQFDINALWPAELARLDVDSALVAGRVTVLIDGWDECARDNREGLKSLVRALLNQWPKTHLRLASRVHGYEYSPVPDARELEICPFDDRNVSAFLDAWLGQQESASVKAALRAYVGLRRFAVNPHLLGLLCLSASRQALEFRRERVYESCLKFILSDSEKRLGKSTAPPRIEDAAAIVAGQFPGPLERVVPWMAESGLVRKAETGACPAVAAFGHWTFYEFLTAYDISRLPVEKQAAILQLRCQEAIWDEVCQFIILLSATPVALLEAIRDCGEVQEGLALAVRSIRDLGESGRPRTNEQQSLYGRLLVTASNTVWAWAEKNGGAHPRLSRALLTTVNDTVDWRVLRPLARWVRTRPVFGADSDALTEVCRVTIESRYVSRVWHLWCLEIARIMDGDISFPKLFHIVRRGSPPLAILNVSVLVLMFSISWVFQLSQRLSRARQRAAAIGTSDSNRLGGLVRFTMANLTSTISAVLFTINHRRFDLLQNYVADKDFSNSDRVRALDLLASDENLDRAGDLAALADREDLPERVRLQLWRLMQLYPSSSSTQRLSNVLERAVLADRENVEILRPGGARSALDRGEIRQFESALKSSETCRVFEALAACAGQRYLEERQDPIEASQEEVGELSADPIEQFGFTLRIVAHWPGSRRDLAAHPLMQELLQHADPVVVLAARSSLGDVELPVPVIADLPVQATIGSRLARTFLCLSLPDEEYRHHLPEIRSLLPGREEYYFNHCSDRANQAPSAVDALMEELLSQALRGVFPLDSLQPGIERWNAEVAGRFSPYLLRIVRRRADGNQWHRRWIRKTPNVLRRISSGLEFPSWRLTRSALRQLAYVPDNLVGDTREVLSAIAERDESMSVRLSASEAHANLGRRI